MASLTSCGSSFHGCISLLWRAYTPHYRTGEVEAVMVVSREFQHVAFRICRTSMDGGRFCLPGREKTRLAFDG